MNATNHRRVVVTGVAAISPFGLTVEDLWAGLIEGRSAVGPLSAFPVDGLPLRYAAEANCFTGHISEFGELDASRKKSIRKGLKVMCRETQMAVAAAQRALSDSGLVTGASPTVTPERFGCVFGSDYMLTMPEDFTAAVERCRGSDGQFDFNRWGAEGLPSMTPLWLLKYLPNMPASHIAIFNDLRGPSNSLTVREASGHIAAGEAAITIKRGAADVMLVGATGTRIHPMKMVHAILNEQVALGDDSPETWSRPFDRDRKGMVLGEGAAVLILEELQHAQNRNAQIYGEILGHAAASHVTGMAVGQRKSVVRSVTSRALASAGISSDALGHVHAQGLSTTEGDKEEYGGLRESLGETMDQLPLVSAKSNFGHLGAGSGLIECIASLLALQKNELFLHKNYETQDAECPIRAAIRGDTAGDSFLSFAATPQGQAGSLVFGRCPEGAIGAAS